MLIAVNPVNSASPITVNSDKIVTIAKAKRDDTKTELFLSEVGVITVTETYAAILNLLD